MRPPCPPLLAKCGQRFQPRAKLTENRASRQEKTAADSATMRLVKLVSNPPNPFESQYRELLEPPPSVKVQIYEDDTRSILSHNDSPDLAFRWSVNPYRGCFHACAYCYARPTHEYLGFGAGSDFESKLVVKRDAAALLREAFLKPSWRGELVVFSGATDCYQPVEASLGLTRACLEVCAEFRNPVAIITKAALPDRILKIAHRLQDMRGGRLNTSRFFDRHRGQGAYGEMLDQLFLTAKRKAGFPEDAEPTMATTFRRPQPQQVGLF